MKIILKKYNQLKWITLLILTNLLSIYLFTSGLLTLPNTIVLHNNSSEFLTELEKINSINNLMNNSYIGDVNNSAMGETLIKSMFNYLGDPYSQYYSGEDFNELLNTYNGSFGGIGVTIDGTDPNNLIIVDVIDDSPAQKAGIEPNDIIKKVNGEDITGQGVDLVVTKTRGQIGTNVELTILRNDQEKTFKLTRDNINIKTVAGTMINNIGYIMINSFDRKTPDQFEKEVNDLISQGATGLIIDLRNNGGGTVSAAVEVADLLMDEDQVGYAVTSKNKREYFTSKNGKINIPFIILVNENTASASELLSGALQKSGVPIIGQKTFGKGVIQSLAKLKDGTGLKLTVQEYFLKDDTPVNKIGITPNIIVENTIDPEQNTYIDNQLNTALEYLQTQVQ